MYRGYEYADVLQDVMDGDRLSLSPRYPLLDATTAEAVVAYRLLSCLCGCSCVAHSALWTKGFSPFVANAPIGFLIWLC